MNPWPFVVGAYAIFFAGLLLDGMLPWWRARRTLELIDQRRRREQSRHAATNQESP